MIFRDANKKFTQEIPPNEQFDSLQVWDHFFHFEMSGHYF